MKVKSHSVYYLIEGDPFLSIAKEFCKLHLEAHGRICEYVHSINGEFWRLSLSGRISGIKFKDGYSHVDFKKPDKYGACYPKRKSEHYAKFQDSNLKMPNATEFVLSKVYIPINLDYQYGEVTGGRSVGHPFTPIGLYWFSLKNDAPILLEIPNVEYTRESMKIENPDISFKKDGEWKMNETGLKKILIEEWDLMVARDKVKHKEE
jgi:hypothetical protein